jgi:hypothetical protein
MLRRLGLHFAGGLDERQQGQVDKAAVAARQFPVTAVARTLGVARSSLAPKPVPARRRGRPTAPEDELFAQITAIIATLPTYGYRRVHALLRR